eukprot:s775_g15.t1
MICGWGPLRFCQIFLLLALLFFTCNDFGLWRIEEEKDPTRRATSPRTQSTESTEATEATESRPAQTAEETPFKVSDGDPPVHDFAPVFIEETLMLRKDLRIRELQQWNFTVEDPEKAVFYIVCCGPVQRFLELPPRTPDRPYLCYDCDAKLQLSSLAQEKCQGMRRKCDLNIVKLLARRDFMFSSSDLRGWDLKNDSALLVPGVTHVHHIPAPEKLRKNKVKPSDPPKYFLTFQGIRNNGLDGASYVRSNLESMLNSSMHRPELSGCPTRSVPSPTSVMLPSDVFIAIADKAQRHKEMRPYFSLFDSAYGLVLHGHGRWSYRLMEVLNGEAIPVILADGWKLPLDELIDWEKISLLRSEQMACDPAALIESLPRELQRIQHTRQQIRNVYGKFMETQEKRLVALLRAAALWKRNWKGLEKGTLRMLADAALKNLNHDPGKIE